MGDDGHLSFRDERRDSALVRGGFLGGGLLGDGSWALLTVRCGLVFSGPVVSSLREGVRADPGQALRGAFLEASVEQRTSVYSGIGVRLRNYRYDDVPGFGSVVLSRHAQDRAEEMIITDFQVDEALFKGRDVVEGAATLREHNGVRLVIIRPTPWRGLYLVKTVFRVERQAKVR